MQQAPTLARLFGSPSAGRRLRVDEIGVRVTAEELLNMPLFIYLAVNGLFLTTSHIVYQVTQSLFWLGPTLAFFRNRCRIHWELWTCRFAFIFLVWVLASVTWGTSPFNVTWVPSVTAICTFLYYSYLIDRFSLNDFTRMMVWAFGILLVASLVAAILVPSIGIGNEADDPGNGGAWRGVFVQKNQLGIACAMGVAVALGLNPKSDIDRMWRWLLVIASLICVRGSQSREAWIAIGLQLVFLFFMLLLRSLDQGSRLPVLLGGLLFFFSLSAIIYLNLDAALALIGRTRDATGRTEIWNNSLLLIRKRPWLGYGTFGVWKTPVAWDIVVRAGWNVTSSHNNYIELLIGYGIIGLCLYLPIIGSSLLYMFRALLSYDLRYLQVPIYVMIGILVTSMAAPLILYSPAVGMILLLYCVSHLEKVERSGFMRLRD
jgi:O-antigen ligase